VPRLPSGSRLLSEGRPLGNWSFFRSARRIAGASTDGLRGNESSSNSDCVGLGLALVTKVPRAIKKISVRYLEAAAVSWSVSPQAWHVAILCRVAGPRDRRRGSYRLETA
jgi:hypothetical protein